MKQPEDVFFSSTFAKIMCQVDKWSEEQRVIAGMSNGQKLVPQGTAQNTVKNVRDILGGLR